MTILLEIAYILYVLYAYTYLLFIIIQKWNQAQKHEINLETIKSINSRNIIKKHNTSTDQLGRNL